MSVVLPAVVAALFLLWRVRRARSKRVLAGLDGSKPVFQMEPPRRRISGIRGERLR
jgi:hypothetical protein